VEHPARVAELHRGNQLLEVLSGNFFLQPSLGDLVEKLAAAYELHDEVDLGFGGHNFEELDDVGVANAAEDGDLALDVGHQTALEDLFLVYDLDGHSFSGFDVPGVVNLREGSVPQEFSQLEPAQQKVRVFLLGTELCHGVHPIAKTTESVL